MKGEVCVCCGECLLTYIGLLSGRDTVFGVFFVDVPLAFSFPLSSVTTFSLPPSLPSLFFFFYLLGTTCLSMYRRLL